MTAANQLCILKGIYLVSMNNVASLKHFPTQIKMQNDQCCQFQAGWALLAQWQVAFSIANVTIKVDFVQS